MSSTGNIKKKTRTFAPLYEVRCQELLQFIAKIIEILLGNRVGWIRSTNFKIEAFVLIYEQHKRSR